MMEPVKIMLIAACHKGYVDPELYDLIAFGRKLQALRGGAMGIWILGDAVDKAAQDMAEQVGLPVTVVQDQRLGAYLNETYCAVLTQEMEALHPAFVCTAHTSRGWEWAPALAARAGAGCICGVDGLVEFQGRLCFQRDLYGGKVKGLYASSADTTVITVQPGIFKFEPSAEASPAAPLIHKDVSWPSGRTRYLGSKKAEADSTHITSAPIIVAVGNGIGERENMELIHRLAKLFSHAEVAGTRILCDRGWLEYNRQVGVTGASVSPALYLACGISGASQHVRGMRGARFVIAINTDPGAPMFNEADICIVEDIVSFIPLLEDAFRQIAERSEDFSNDPKTDGRD
ncbi:MAG: electron transfer flavoprotein subunit alpha/FixB family protein [Deltaproteobacteria bacterium]|nr:electron transfer flavoprotein subunit alpha/FixB family protein [Deltaproteobacteria bacterium]